MKPIRCKLLVLGGGPGGYVCAIRAGQLGVDTVLVEEADLGGVCLNVGCIPSKALIHAADEFFRTAAYARGNPLGIRLERPAIDLARTVEWKDGIVAKLTTGVGALLRKAHVKVVHGRGGMRDGKTCLVHGDMGTQQITAEHVVIATGSAPIELPGLPFGGDIVTSSEVLALESVPERLAVVGGGYIGLEIGIAFAKLGTYVTVVEAEERILPRWDADLTHPVTERLEALGVRVLTRAKARRHEAAVLVAESGGREERVPADQVLVTVGRRPRTDGWGLEELDLAMDGPFLRIDERCRTSMRNVWAVGDVTGEPMLAHRAMAQGEMVAEIVAGRKRAFDKACIPEICFTDPEIVTAGLTVDQARAQGLAISTGTFPFRANGRALTMESEVGFVRIVARADNHLVLGVQAVGTGVSELAASFGLAIEMGARLEDVAATVHAHPTLGEAFQEAALQGLGHALHI